MDQTPQWSSALKPARTGTDAQDVTSRCGAGDAGSAIAGWLIRVSLVLIVLGVVAMDAISVGSTRFQVEDAATQAAAAASSAARTSANNRHTALVAAQDSLLRSGQDFSLVDNAVVVTTDSAVTVTVTKTAQTLVLWRIKPLAKYGEISYTTTQRAAV